MKKIIKIKVFLLTVFFLAVTVWFSPILFKGYLPHDIGSNSIILARNLAQTGVFGAENDLNVMLSSNLVKENAHISAQGNKLTPLIYGKIFEITGPLSERGLILLTTSIHALTLVIFTLLVFYLLGFKAAVFFSLTYIFLPFNWRLPYSLGGYEFALFFFSSFFLLYFWGKNRKYAYIYLILAGLLLGLACLAKEAFFLFLPFFFAYLWWRKFKRHLLYLLIPLLIIFSCFWLPNILKSSNIYLLMLTSQAPEELKSADYGRYGHFVPDPYTYHLDQDYLKNYQDQLKSNNLDFSAKANVIKNLANNGFRTPSVSERLKVGGTIFLSHLSRFFSLEDFGGPFVFLLMILGAYGLKRKRSDMLIFASGWIFSVIFLLSFLTLAGRNHLSDFGWILALLISLGLLLIIEVISGYFNLTPKKSAVIMTFVAGALLYNLLLVNHIVWGKLYDERQSFLIEAYSQKIRESNILDQDVIAVPEQVELFRLNYLNNKSLVIFKPKTIEDLINKGELNSAFEKFGVKYVLGYSDELSQKITSRTEVTNIASDSLELKNVKPSAAKVWLMNLVR